MDRSLYIYIYIYIYVRVYVYVYVYEYYIYIWGTGCDFVVWLQNNSNEVLIKGSIIQQMFEICHKLFYI